MKQAAERLLTAIQHLEQATSRDRVVPIKTESLKEILEAAEALRTEMKQHCTACGRKFTHDYDGPDLCFVCQLRGLKIHPENAIPTGGDHGQTLP